MLNTSLTSRVAADTSTAVTSISHVPLHTSVRLATLRLHHAPAAITSLKSFYLSAYELHPHADVFTSKSSPVTLYHEIRPSLFTRNPNHAPPSTVNIHPIAEVLAKVTQLQQLPQAKPTPTVEQTLQLIKDSQAMDTSSNVHLHKFASNHKEVLEALPVDDHAKNLDL